MGMYLGCFGGAVGYIERTYIQFGVMGANNPLPFFTKGEICRRGMQYLGYPPLFAFYGPKSGITGPDVFWTQNSVLDQM